MARIKFSFHPLFLIVGACFLVANEFLLFLILVLSALIHELGHSFSAKRAGYYLNKITLMPFGAIIDGSKDISSYDEFKIALAGPLTSLGIVTIFIALWWLYPFLYPYTDLIVYVNLGLFLVNIIPAYPLDGGRILNSLLRRFLSETKSMLVCKMISFVLGLLLVALFVYSCFVTINFSILFFALFLLLSIFDKKKENVYIRVMCTFFNTAKLKRGVGVKKIAVGRDITVQKLLRLIDFDCINEILVLDEELKEKKLIRHKDLEHLCNYSDIYAKLYEVFNV